MTSAVGQSALYLACSMMRDINLRVLGKTLIAGRDGQMRPQKPAQWFLQQNKTYMARATGLHASIRAEFQNDTFSVEMSLKVC